MPGSSARPCPRGTTGSASASWAPRSWRRSVTSAKLPYAGTAIAAEAIAGAGTGVLAERWLPRTIAGDAVLGVALAGETNAVRWEGDTLEGTVSFVPDGLWAALVLVPAVDAAGYSCGFYAVQTRGRWCCQSLEVTEARWVRPTCCLVLHGVPGVAAERPLGPAAEIAQFLPAAAASQRSAPMPLEWAEAALTLTAGICP